MLEPANSQQAKDMVVAGIQLSERYRVPVLIRMTTRVCHSKSIVERNEPVKANLAEYKKNIWQYTTIPAVSQLLRKELEKKLIDLHKESNDSPFNKIEWNDKKIGIIASGIACEYAKEVFKKEASYLCLGFTNPLPMEMITEFASEVDNLYLIEELEPYLEEQIKAAGIPCIGKDKVPNIGELSPHILRKAFKGIKRELIPTDSSKLVHRPPMLCAGCPHRGVFYVLGKRNDIFISGDIGCYGLGALPPLNAMDTCLCMGASISSGHGVAKAFKEYNIEKRSVCVIGDSTFFHSGMTGLLNVVYNASQTITIILDNRITGMTGHQDHPGTGFTAQGKPAKEANIEQIARALGIEQVRAINPLNLKQMQGALEWALAFEAPSVIIARWPCALKKLSTKDKEEFDGCFTKCIVDQAVCTGCKKCVRIGCPALRFDKQKKQAFINAAMCAGCGICAQICPIEAIVS